MRAYTLTDNSGDDIIFGVDNITRNTTLEKLNKGLAKIRPYNELVPFYKDSKFAFMGLNAFKYFLFKLCEFTYMDIIELEILGYEIIEEEIICVCNGMSRILCTHLDDEIVELKKESLTEFFANADSREYEIVPQPQHSPGDIKDCKAQFYSKIKFKK